MATADPKAVSNIIGLKGVEQITGLSMNRVRRLNTEGKIPGGKRDERGAWRFDRATIEAWASNRPARSTDGRSTYGIRLNEEEATLVTKALAGTGIELKKKVYKAKPKKAKGVKAEAPEEVAAA